MEIARKAIVAFDPFWIQVQRHVRLKCLPTRAVAPTQWQRWLTLQCGTGCDPPARNEQATARLYRIEPRKGSTQMSELAVVFDQREARTNMFVMATIYSDSGSAPVKIRNVSATGALIEGSNIPTTAARVSLSRGSLSIVGKIVWRSDCRAGIAFDSSVCVADWLPNGRSPAPQQRVDEIIQQVKAGPNLSLLTSQPAPIGALELARAKKMIEILADRLSEDVDVIALHGSMLQALDVAAQLFGKLAAERL